MWQLETSFLPRLIFNWRTFSRWVTVRWSRGWAKSQVLANQNPRNSWCQIVRGSICYRTPPVAASEKDGCRSRDINDGIFYNEKEKKLSIAKRVIREIFFLYHSLSFVVTLCHLSYHLLSLDLPLVCLFINDPFWTVLSDSKVYQTLFVH